MSNGSDIYHGGTEDKSGFQISECPTCWYFAQISNLLRNSFSP